MDRAGLKLVREAPGVARPWAAPALGALLLALAAWATLLGADAARVETPASEIARSALERALERGNRDPQVRQALLDLRGALARRPLDSATRVVYSDLLLALCRRADQRAAPAFHARLAARLAPVTVPVLRRAALVLARGGAPDEAVALTREMFRYDSRSAADLLLMLEPALYPAQVEQALADTAEAWLAWYTRLSREGRALEATSCVEEAYARWPDDLALLRTMAARAVGRGEWERLAELLPPDRTFPDRPGVAGLLVYRARLSAERDDLAAARADVERALELAGQAPLIGLLGGDALWAANDVEGAKRLWNRALFALRGGSHAMRRNLLLRLARLEDRHGRPATALRLWRSLLEIEPEHREARRRVDDLSGFRR